MKSFKEVEEGRKQYYANPTVNSTHRSSLLIPELPNSEAEISFVNHFLLKRGYKEVSLKITALDSNGKRIEAQMFQIDQPIVYTFPLSQIFKEKKPTSYLAEFFCAKNLFIPFPAVMVNHKGKNFINQLHSYNRILNDIFEDDSINKNHQKEASIDLLITEEAQSFISFYAGIENVNSELSIEVYTNGKTYKKKIPLDVKRLNQKTFFIRDIFPEIPMNSEGIIKVDQPHQKLFYGRILCGTQAKDGTFVANHSYYDSSTTHEYWDNNLPAEGFYPFFENYNNIVRMHPIMSPSELNVTIDLIDFKGNLLNTVQAGTLVSPSNSYLELNITDYAKEQKIPTSSIASYILKATPQNGNTPTRVNHQYVLSLKKEYESSINISCLSSNVFAHPSKKGFLWGQSFIGPDYESHLGVTAAVLENTKNVDSVPINLKLYTQDGEVFSEKYTIPKLASLKLNINDVLKSKYSLKSGESLNVWYTIESQLPHLRAFAVTSNKVSGHCCGEHSF